MTIATTRGLSWAADHPPGSMIASAKATIRNILYRHIRRHPVAQIQSHALRDATVASLGWILIEE